jgi:chemotaxis protein CheX
MQIDEQMLQQITVDICQTMLGLELTPITPDVEAARQLVASVEIRGVRDTIVEVLANEHLMTSIAEVMFSSERGSLSENEIRDAFGEIANMIGGNVKGVAGEEAQLSLPLVAAVEDWQNRFPHGCLRTSFDCCGSTLMIVLREAVQQVSSANQTAAAQIQGDRLFECSMGFSPGTHSPVQ